MRVVNRSRISRNFATEKWIVAARPFDKANAEVLVKDRQGNLHPDYIEADTKPVEFPSKEKAEEAIKKYGFNPVSFKAVKKSDLFSRVARRRFSEEPSIAVSVPYIINKDSLYELRKLFEDNGYKDASYIIYDIENECSNDQKKIFIKLLLSMQRYFPSYMLPLSYLAEYVVDNIDKINKAMDF